MDYELTEEQKILQKSAADFLKKECPKELVRRLEETDEKYSPELWRKMAELGWMGLHLLVVTARICHGATVAKNSGSTPAPSGRVPW